MVSFVMLTWNRKQFVEKMFSSFYKSKSEKYNYEFLIIDNGSIDGTASLLKEAEKNDPHIKIWYNKKNKSLNEYKKLFNRSKGDYIIIIDDDVIEFPKDFDKIMVDFINVFYDFGFIALDVIQNEFTNGAKPELKFYKDILKNGLTISEGPAGGWCSIFRKTDYKKIKFKMAGKRLDMKNGEDGVLCYLFENILGLKQGLTKGIKCFHACGPWYSKEFGYLDRDIQKYKASGLDNFVELYNKYKA
ncbi:MAG: glycosyltransferase family 2 protein [Spirochaetaceae bacterium]|nr:glycosyltransferase family 2 protein [Spirochaetaceae bacterium]